jgi:uncharacterized protein YbaP (TraB family)
MTRWLCVLALCVLPGIAAAGDQEHPITLWRVAGATNSIYLMGSIHLLREQDHPLPTVIDTAYSDADVVVMEIDMDDLDPVYTQAAFNRAGVLTDGTTLRDLMGEEAFAAASDAAAAVDIPLDMLAKSEPWLAAITVELMLLYRIGFNPALGIEMTVTQRATADGKPIEGLETIDEQLAFLDGLPAEAQREIDDLIDAWHHGDTATLEESLLESAVGLEELNEVLVSGRNRRWAETISTWLDDERNYLIVVGALHLVGDQGVPALLEKRGFGIHQLSEPASLR